MNDAIRHVIIVGGGSAGWLTAAVIAAGHRPRPDSHLKVTLLESPDVASIGVGEGTWPAMRETLRKVGVSESKFFKECDASFKQGSLFRRWVDGSESDYYFHPFVLPEGYGETDLVTQWQERYPHIRYADLVSFQPHLCMQGKAPKQTTTPEYAGVANYGYHLDAGKFGTFLRQHCIEHLGVSHVLDHVTGINSHDNGDIASLQTRSNGAMTGDLFVDCTGMQSLLLGEHFKIPFISQSHVLFNDRALAVQVPYPADNTPIVSHTTSTAQSNGWIWDIGLPTRRGIGHVYSSAHTTDEDAERELRAYIAPAQEGRNVPSLRKIAFQPGYREKFWQRNCVAIGLSAGFIEPLEASALALIELSASMLSDQMPSTREEMEIVSRRFNESFTYRWERIIQFLKLHYVLTRRSDTSYWRDHCNPESIPDQLRESLVLWKHLQPSQYDFGKAVELFPSASYHYILYGMGFKTEYRGSIHQWRASGTAEQYFRGAAELARKMLTALPTNRELIDHMKRHGLQRI